MQNLMRLDAFTTAAVLLLLFTAPLGNSYVLLGVAGVLLVVGFVLLPPYRRRGGLATLIAAAAATGLVVVLRLVERP